MAGNVIKSKSQLLFYYCKCNRISNIHIFVSDKHQLYHRSIDIQLLEMGRHLELGKCAAIFNLGNVRFFFVTQLVL